MTPTRAAAEALRASAQPASKPVTRTLKQVASENGGKMAGPRRRLKEVDSIERKIVIQMRRFGVSADEAATSINDSLRYTMRFPDQSLTAGTRGASVRLEEQGYEVLEVKNYWMQANSYKGINVVPRPV